MEVPQCPLMTQSGHSPFTIAAMQLHPDPHSAGGKSLM
jgi:hypothetical protein